ncbi:MAG: PP2C family protein-serine/threonine phosphatase [Pseudomonadota bacterium]|uniref:PP2C family protein-serine/threonine phosphatase n=1 Tax=Guyparkeria sp. TaxID=2035736 RepID=UPI0039794DC2
MNQDGQFDIRVVPGTPPGVACGLAPGGRPSQQDDLICLHDAREATTLLVLADGMGGDGAGELASGGVVHAARELWDERVWRDQPGALFLETLCQAAHAEIRRRNAWVAAEPHSTIVALLLREGQAFWVHVGDSRLYHFRGRRCLSVTRDHSLARLKLDRGEIREADLAHDPDQHVLLRGLGGSEPPEVEHGYAATRPGDGFVLCSDGVWETLSRSELAGLLRARDLATALYDGLVLGARRGGEAGDNLGLILARPERSPSWLARLAGRLSIT